MIRLGVNIDHVATLRQARRGRFPDPVAAASLAELGGAGAITVHLREDRRHIQERDVRILRETVQTRLNLEAAVDPTVVALALELKPHQVTFVPERREELTTEGGLDVIAVRARLADAVARCRDAGIEVSLFINAIPAQVEVSAQLGADAVELHTGRYADAPSDVVRHRELLALTDSGALAVASGLLLHAGHGLDYQNVASIASIPAMRELNIGFSIVARSVFVGIERAVREMKEAIRHAGEGG